MRSKRDLNAFNFFLNEANARSKHKHIIPCIWAVLYLRNHLVVCSYWNYPSFGSTILHNYNEKCFKFGPHASAIHACSGV